MSSSSLLLRECRQHLAHQFEHPPIRRLTTQVVSPNFNDYGGPAYIYGAIFFHPTTMLVGAAGKCLLGLPGKCIEHMRNDIVVQ
jgi:hypothetical protein